MEIFVVHEVTYSIDPISIAGISNQRSQKPLMIALHGWLDNANSFLPLIPYLSDYHVIAIDWAGHGHSEHRPLGTDYLQMDYVDDLNQLIEINDWHGAILLGHSMGGILASIYASVYPEKVTKVISIDSFGPLVSDEHDTVKILKEGIESRQKARNKPQSRLPETSLQNLIEKRSQHTELSHLNISLLIKRSVKPASTCETEITPDTLVQWTTDKRLRKPSLLRLTEGQGRAIIQAIGTEMLVIAATQGFVTKRKQLARRTDWNSNIKTVEIEGGHHIHMENPEGIAELLKQFIAI
jgi:pimeloyl-ACP methyl ester carboxylesterase